jgi:hypothetical protein
MLVNKATNEGDEVYSMNIQIIFEMINSLTPTGNEPASVPRNRLERSVDVTNTSRRLFWLVLLPYLSWQFSILQYSHTPLSMRLPKTYKTISLQKSSTKSNIIIRLQSILSTSIIKIHIILIKYIYSIYTKYL